jgi:hypothetical protein
MTVNNIGKEKLNGTSQSVLATAPVDYSRQYQDLLNNQLRLYFTQIDNLTSSLLNQSGTRYLSASYGAFENRATVTLTAADTAYAVPFDSFVSGNDVSVVTDGTALTRITVANAGVYSLQMRLQFANSSTTVLGDVSVWLSKNGTNIVNTNTVATAPLQHSSIPGYVVVSFSQLLSLEADDYIQLYTSANVATITMPYIAAQSTPTRPATCSAIGNLTYVSRL